MWFCKICQKISHENINTKNYDAFEMTNDSLRDITNDFGKWKRNEIAEKNQFCFCRLSSKPKMKFQMKKLKQRNFNEVMIVLEKIPKKLLYLNKKEVVQNCQKFSCEFHQYLLVQFHLKILISFSLTFLKIFFNSNDFISFLLFFCIFSLIFENFQAKFIIEIL